MLKTYTNPVYPYRRSRDQDKKTPSHHPVIIVGAGPCGLAAALDFAKQGIRTVVIDDNNTVSVGSRAICFSKRTLEIIDRYGCATPMIEKGVTWKKGKVFFKSNPLFEFDLLPEPEHKMPAFINLQQYYFEEYLVNHAHSFDEIDLRWKHKVTAVTPHAQSSHITVDTQDGTYEMTCDYLLVADGANSKIRTMLGLESKGQIFEDRFLIADVVMKAQFPPERWFWFDPPFHPNQSVLLHRQADNVWRIDFQLGWDADPEEEKKEENIRRRVSAMLGEDVEYELEWASVYTFQCRKMDDFIHQRVLFMGDAAHQVSPFGARGANGGIQSVENLAWKIARILKKQAPPALLETYNTERQAAAAENILHSTRATDFITPKNRMSRIFRDETLYLAMQYPFARSLINSGRLSQPHTYQHSPLATDDQSPFNSVMKPGAVCTDAPLLSGGARSWLLESLGNQFTCLVHIDVAQSRQAELASLLERIETLHPDLSLLLISHETHKQAPVSAPLLIDHEQWVQKRYDLMPGNVYLIRPDQHVVARWRDLEPDAVLQALHRALGFDLEKTA